MHLKPRESWILYEDSFSCVCVLIEPASCIFVFYHSLLSLSRVICAQPSGRQRPAHFIPLYHYSSTARSRIREWASVTHTQVSQLLFFTSWFRHLLSIQLNKIFSSPLPWKIKKKPTANHLGLDNLVQMKVQDFFSRRDNLSSRLFSPPTTSQDKNHKTFYFIFQITNSGRLWNPIEPVFLSSTPPFLSSFSFCLVSISPTQK